MDELKSSSTNARQFIAGLEQRERARTDIKGLKVGYNQVFGYYIEVSKVSADKVPNDYIRRQTLANAERYIVPELKEYESLVLNARDRLEEAEQAVYHRVCTQLAESAAAIGRVASAIARLDVFTGLADTAIENRYVRPKLDHGNAIRVINGRHPVVERVLNAGKYVPNDVELSNDDTRVMVLTGPNMAGKSTYLRQVSLITLMAQIGSFIPADSAHISIVDRIFSRVGAQDHLQKGMSTFMVEMNETANILNNATERSLIILDEIGRGTSTFDGISIAWSIVEYLHGDSTKGGPKTLFATHYHELTDLALVLKGVKNFNVQVKEWNNEIIFLRKIIPGGADKSYGIQVARLAGLPEKLLRRAHEVLFNLEKSEFDEVGAPKIARSEEEIINPKAEQLGLFLETAHPAIKQLEDIEPDNLSPRQAMETLYQLKNLIKKT